MRMVVSSRWCAFVSLTGRSPTSKALVRVSMIHAVGQQYSLRSEAIQGSVEELLEVGFLCTVFMFCLLHFSGTADGFSMACSLVLFAG